MSEIVVPSTWRDGLEALGGRRREVWLVVGLVVVAVIAAIALRGAAQPRIAPPAQGPDVAAATLAPAEGVAGVTPAAGATPAPGSVILVHVAGAVERPGLYELSAGARIADAIDLARGPKPTADLGALNLAEPLVDGQKIDVPRRGDETVATVPTSTPGSSSIPGPAPAPGVSPATVIDLNTADQATLETIPDVGPVTAQAIITYRTEIGAFDSVEQLLEVSGIGPATLETMRPYVTV
ncbi:MAG: helix-hairpin-helix domain-containing protein [Actinomycetota bacterium]|nr:helix-hairpin-helix domain-containing protein [Actinomycetota bacterium]